MIPNGWNHVSSSQVSLVCMQAVCLCMHACECMWVGVHVRAHALSANACSASACKFVCIHVFERVLVHMGALEDT